MKRFVLSLALVCPLAAGELAVLKSGFRIRADRHELIDGTVRLHTASGTMDIPSDQIGTFEVEEYTPPAPVASPQPSIPSVEPLAQPIDVLADAAARHGLRAEFVRSVAAVESAGRVNAVSPKGAIGLMQLMPGTAKDLGVDPYDPAQNAHGGSQYLKELLLRYAHTKDPVRLALAAYNAGPGAVDRYGTIPPYRETQAYVEKVLRRYLSELKSAKDRS